MKNLEHMQEGYSPYGKDGQKVNLHHAFQDNDGAIAEMSGTYHKANNDMLHPNRFLPSQIDRVAFGIWRSSYWKWRASFYI